MPESRPVPALRELQADFAGAMLTGHSPAALVDAIRAAGIAPEDRLAVYRANVVLSLRRLLESTFPASRRLLGELRFAQLADGFVRRSPPDRPQLLAYGAGFPVYLAEAEPLIGDVARLEWAREEAFNAADAVPLDAAAVATIPTGRYPALRFQPHPSLRLIRSDGPVHSLWLGLDGAEGPEQVLVVRPEMTVLTRPLLPADLALLTQLLAGRTLADAAATAIAADPSFDLQAALADHLRGGSFACCR